jgi:6-pyruvoyltetrahydropterin/6-carboxytetrahydropterin synthase
VRIGKRYRFDAAHRLPNHDGKCARPHGHTYELELMIDGEPRVTEGAVIQPALAESDEGMVADYAVLDAYWAELEPMLDHRDLNETIGAAGCWPTTAENIALWILRNGRSNGIELSAVRVSETPSTFAVVEA